MTNSQLKNKLDMLAMNNKHEEEMLKMKQHQEMEEMRVKQSIAKKDLLDTCTHKYDDGNSAKTTGGTQWNHWNECSICKRTI